MFVSHIVRWVGNWMGYDSSSNDVPKFNYYDTQHLAVGRIFSIATILVLMVWWCSFFWKKEHGGHRIGNRRTGVMVYDVEQQPVLRSDNAFNMPQATVSVIDIFTYESACSEIGPTLEDGEIADCSVAGTTVAEDFLNNALDVYDELYLITIEEDSSNARTKSTFINTLFDSIIDRDEKVRTINLMEVFYLLHPEVTKTTFDELLGRYRVMRSDGGSGSRRQRHIEIVDLFERMMVEQDVHVFDDDDRAAAQVAEFASLIH
jgi:hypothetical protein